MAHSFCRAHERRQRLLTPQRLCVPTRKADGLATERAPIKEPLPATERAPIKEPLPA
jgi:hypothetical protein